MGTAELFGAPPPIIDRPLIAYAFLAQANPASGDLLSGLAPIFKPIARELAGRAFDPKEFSRRVEDLYQISIHPWAADDLARRMEKAGLLIKAEETRYAVSYTYAAIDDEFNEVGEADVRLIVKRFVDYARPLCANHNLILDDRQLEEAFFGQIVTMDFHAALLKPKQPISGSTIRLPIKKASSDGEKDLGHNQQKTSIAILCAGFILSMYQNDSAAYDLILRIATGAMVAEAVLNIQNPGSDVNFNQLKIVLDSPFVMALLDLDEASSRDYAKTLCDQLLAHGATLQVFRHSVDELREAIDATIASVDNGNGRGALARRLRMRAFRQYVTSVRNDVEGELRRQKIVPVGVPTTRDSFVYFTDANKDGMCTALGHYDNTLARDRDAASIAAIMRLRRGRHVSMSQVHFAQYIFLTSNSRVAKAANDYTVRCNMRGEAEAPPAFTDRYMASLLFVMFGGQGKEITHYQLLANCSAALEPHSEIMSSMHRFLLELDPVRANHFRAIMTDDRASQHLMQLTLGEVCISSADDAAAILSALEQRYDAEAHRQFDQQFAELQQERDEALALQAAEHQQAINAEKTRVDRLQSEVTAAQQVRAQDRLDLDAANRRAEELNEQMAGIIATQQQDVHRRVKEAVEYGYRHGEFRHRELTEAVVLVLLAATVLGSGIIGDEWKILYLMSAFATSVLGGLTFFKNPDKIFGKHIESHRRAMYEKRAKELHVDTACPGFVIDLDNGTVVLPPPN